MTYIILPNAHLDATAALPQKGDNAPYTVSVNSLVRPGQYYTVLCMVTLGCGWLNDGSTSPLTYVGVASVQTVPTVECSSGAREHSLI